MRAHLQFTCSHRVAPRKSHNARLRHLQHRQLKVMLQRSRGALRASGSQRLGLPATHQPPDKPSFVPFNVQPARPDSVRQSARHPDRVAAPGQANHSHSQVVAALAHALRAPEDTVATGGGSSAPHATTLHSLYTEWCEMVQQAGNAGAQRAPHQIVKLSHLNSNATDGRSVTVASRSAAQRAACPDRLWLDRMGLTTCCRIEVCSYCSPLQCVRSSLRRLEVLPGVIHQDFSTDGACCAE